MALVAEGLLSLENTSKGAISKVDKKNLITTIYDLRDNFERNGVLLLNTSLIFENKKLSNYHTKKWKPFIKYLLENISHNIILILFGNSAKKIKVDFNPKQKSIEIEHPYNISFIASNKAYRLFSPMNLLIRK